MTQTAVTTSVVLANTLAVVCMATSELNPLLEYVQNGASVAAVMGIFLWREMKRAERYEKLYDQERRQRITAERKCSSCMFMKLAHEQFAGIHSPKGKDPSPENRTSPVEYFPPLPQSVSSSRLTRWRSVYNGVMSTWRQVINRHI